ncbi:MAG: hypothetical protein GY874_17945 [Desulfobacteraceae bacterium]|nr:hypothetical protein [Desulfobacteraceae bacterium]
MKHVKQILNLIIGFSLLLLYPSLYGIRYCNVSEKLIDETVDIEELIGINIPNLSKNKLKCESFANKNNFTPEDLIKINKKMLIYSDSFSMAGFTSDLAHYIYPVLKLNLPITNDIKKLRALNLEMKDYFWNINHYKNKLFCYLDDEIVEELIYPDNPNEIIFTEQLYERYKKKHQYEYDVSIDEIKAKAQVNLKEYIKKLEGFHDRMKASRLAHEPYRPLIRFIGKSWLIFEIIGMILLFGMAFLQLRTWVYKHAAAHPDEKPNQT